MCARSSRTRTTDRGAVVNERLMELRAAAQAAEAAAAEHQRALEAYNGAAAAYNEAARARAAAQAELEAAAALEQQMTAAVRSPLSPSAPETNDREGDRG